MKSLCAIFLIVALDLTGAEDMTLPPRAEVLKQRRNEEVAKIDRIYLKALTSEREKFMKAGDLENANRIQTEIETVEGALGIEQFESSRERLLAGVWMVVSAGDSYQVTFSENGDVHRLDTGKRWWKWKIKEDILQCDWLTSGWIRFEVPASNIRIWKGRTAAKKKILLEYSHPK